MVNPTVPDVSVIIPAYNALPYLHRGLQSLVDQTLGTDRMEIVVVDDGSTDGTREAVDEWARKHPDLFRVVHSPASGGPATPRNTALDLARGRYVYFLDADDYLGLESLERLVTTADENQSDIVLGKMVQTGERGVPQSMYRRNDLDADLFTSRVYWTLSVLKLFRRSLIEDNSLRFPAELPNGSDQPFAAMAYLRASKISVLADYDFYHVVLRDDGKHVTRSGSLATRLDLHETMCALLAAEVADPEKRAALLTRHFQIDIRAAMARLSESPVGEREALFRRIEALVREHMSPTVRERLTPDMRVVYHLVAEGLLEKAMQAADELIHSEYEVVLADGRAYAGLPYFRDPAWNLPDELFDITARLRADVVLDSFSSSECQLRLRGRAGFRHVAGSPQAELVLRSRGAEPSEHVTPATVTDGGHFEVSVDLERVAGGGPLAKGAWDVLLRLSQSGVTRSVPLARSVEAQAESSEQWLLWEAAGNKPRFSLVRLTARRTLRIDAGLSKTKRAEQFAGWELEPDGDDLVVTARLQSSLDAPAEFLLRHVDGRVQAVPTRNEGQVLTGRVAVFDLPDGRWSLRLRIGTPPAHWGVGVPAGTLEPMVRTQGITQKQVVVAAGEAAVLDVATASLPRRLARRLRALSGR